MQETTTNDKYDPRFSNASEKIDNKGIRPREYHEMMQASDNYQQLSFIEHEVRRKTMNPEKTAASLKIYEQFLKELEEENKSSSTFESEEKLRLLKEQFEKASNDLKTAHSKTEDAILERDIERVSKFVLSKGYIEAYNELVKKEDEKMASDVSKKENNIVVDTDQKRKEIIIEKTPKNSLENESKNRASAPVASTISSDFTSNHVTVEDYVDSEDEDDLDDEQINRENDANDRRQQRPVMTAINGAYEASKLAFSRLSSAAKQRIDNAVEKFKRTMIMQVFFNLLF